MLYDDVISLMDRLLKDFSDVLTKESIGKTYEGRNIWMLKLDATPLLDKMGISSRKDKKALLMTGAHHSRELVSTQMPLYTLLDLLQQLAKYQSNPSDPTN